MLRCPKCGTEEDLKWFIRHQDLEDDEDSTSGNVITILCTTCGYNQSFILADCLEDIFPEWVEEENEDYTMFEDIFGSFNMPFDETMENQQEE